MIWFFWFVLFIWSVLFDQTSHINKRNQPVLASFRPSTYPRGYASALHSLRTCWTAFLSSLPAVEPRNVSATALCQIKSMILAHGTSFSSADPFPVLQNWGH
jgi:hypothetical protein